jgi:hypothetical protein
VLLLLHHFFFKVMVEPEAAGFSASAIASRKVV